MHVTGAIAALALIASPIAATTPAPADPAFRPESFRATVGFLADDLLEGRDTGSRGHEIAARYVASRFEALGLQPGGDKGSWYQRVTLQKTVRGEVPATVTVSGASGAPQMWTHGGDVIVGVSPNEPDLDITAPLVFVGYGIQDKRLGIDDYAGLDVKGKIVVVLRGYPKGVPSEEGAHVGATKAKAAQDHGAIGMLTVGTLLSKKTRPWPQMLHFADEPDFAWVGSDGKAFDEAPRIRIGATLNDPAAEAVFAGARQSLAAIRAVADKEGGRPKGFALKTKVRIRSQSATTKVTSPNVVGILPGSDPTLKAQYVVLSAHLDHVGIVPAKSDDTPDTDRINNGALDNAAGIATMLEVAKAAAEAPSRPRRSLIFLASSDDVASAKEHSAPTIELTYNWDPEEYAGGRNFGHLAYEVDDIYELCASLQSKGVTINRPPRDGRMAFVRSPDGISVELLQDGRLEPQEPWLSMPNTGEW